MAFDIFEEIMKRGYGFMEASLITESIYSCGIEDESCIPKNEEELEKLLKSFKIKKTEKGKW